MGWHTWTKLWVLALGVSLAQSAWGANPDPFEHATKTVNETAARLPGPQPVAGRIASELNGACACTRFSDESVAQQRGRTGWGGARSSSRTAWRWPSAGNPTRPSPRRLAR